MNDDDITAVLRDDPIVEDCYKAADEIDRLRAALAEAEARLPEGMKHCTIQFKECEVGHGRLTAMNWVDSGCPWCALAEARRERDGARAQCRADIAAMQREIDRAERAEVERTLVLADLMVANMDRVKLEAALVEARGILERATDYIDQAWRVEARAFLEANHDTPA